VRDMQYEIYCGYWIVKNLIFDTFQVKAGRSDGHSLHPGLFHSRDKAKEWIDTLLPPDAGLDFWQIAEDGRDEPYFVTCGEAGTDKCEARAYQITVRQQIAKIAELELQLKQTLENAMSQASVLHERTAELQSKMSALHAIALALPKLDWGSHDQFCIWDEFNEAVQMIQELSE
jgi:hypothetical protein